MQEISTFVILKATGTDFCIYLASDNTLTILVYSDQMTSEARTHTECVWAACGETHFQLPGLDPAFIKGTALNRENKVTLSCLCVGVMLSEWSLSI